MLSSIQSEYEQYKQTSTDKYNKLEKEMNKKLDNLRIAQKEELERIV